MTCCGYSLEIRWRRTRHLAEIHHREGAYVEPRYVQLCRLDQSAFFHHSLEERKQYPRLNFVTVSAHCSASGASSGLLSRFRLGRMRYAVQDRDNFNAPPKRRSTSHPRFLVIYVV